MGGLGGMRKFSFRYVSRASLFLGGFSAKDGLLSGRILNVCERKCGRDASNCRRTDTAVEGSDDRPRSGVLPAEMSNQQLNERISFRGYY